MRSCQECGASLRGRLDKKFCCGDCRSSYHNRKYRDQINLMRTINNCLRRNRKILKEICDKRLSKVDRYELIQRGFQFGYCTHVKQDEKRPVHYCYDVAYYEKQGEIYVELETG
jgi:hypothetical protein